MMRTSLWQILLVALLWLGLTSTATAWVWNQKHMDYNGCDTCHNLHGSPSGGGLLEGVDTESTCRGCHGVAGPGPEAAVHDPAAVGIGTMGYITCRECHDSYHDEGNVDGVDNIKMVGYDWDPIVDPGKDNVFTYATIRVELTSTLPGDPPVYRNVVFSDRSQDFKRPAGNGICQSCHEAGPPTGGSTDLSEHQWGDCTVCHLHSEGFAKLQCVDCHDQNFTVATTAPKVVNKNGATVGAVGSHLRVDGVDPIVGLSDLDWTVQCIECHTGHSGDVVIPNNAAVGIDYQTTGGIGLGGAATLVGATSEAEICWDCHGAGQSEWNALTDHGFTVSGGDDWTAVSFDLAGTTVPTKTTTSIHSVNAGVPEAVASSVTSNVDWNNDFGNGVNAIKPAGSKVLEDVADIRCSYCHDVHDLNAANNDSVSGQPYLRGTWLHNPYVATAIERPPESGDSWSGNRWSHFETGVTVPRLLSDTNGGTAGNGSGNAAGGFQIDQNNGYPTASYINNGDRPAELTDTAGLCVLCHGSTVDSMDEFTSRSLWLGSNGHSNASLGGSGNVAVNLFDARNRDGQLSTAMGFFMAGQGADIPNVNEWGNLTPSGFSRDRRDYLPFGNEGNRDSPDDGNSSGNSATPPRYTGYYTTNPGSTRATTSLPANYTAWYSAGGIGTNADGISGRAHDFSCSKCHTPHASGLPALLVSNCLDYTVSNWSDTGTNDRGDTITIGPSATDRWAVEVMNNCHRKKDVNSGWNVLAPRQ